MDRPRTVIIAGGLVTLAISPHLRVEIDGTRRVVEASGVPGALSTIAAVVVSTGSRSGTVRLTLTMTATLSRRWAVVVGKVGGGLTGFRMVPLDPTADSCVVRLRMGQTRTLLVVEHSVETDPDVVLTALRRQALSARQPIAAVPDFAAVRDLAPKFGHFELFKPISPHASLPPEPARRVRQARASRSSILEPRRFEFAEVGASMLRIVHVADYVNVKVRLSRGEVRIEHVKSHDEKIIVVDAGKALTVNLLRRGFALGHNESGHRTLRLPAVGEPDREVNFTLLAVEEGVGEVQVVVRQEAPIPLATLRLTSTILPATPDAARPDVLAAADSLPPEVVASVAPGVNPFLTPNTLTIDENLEGTTSTLVFDLVLPGVRETFELVIVDKKLVLNKIFEEIDVSWREHKTITDLGERMRAYQDCLRSLGSRLATAVLPGGLLEFLRQNFDDIHELTIITSGETDIPWELAYVLDAKAWQDPDGLGFLGRAGLVRWIYNTAHPEELRVRPGLAYYLIPDYTDATLALPQAALEVDYLKPFAASPVTPSDARGLARLMRSGEVDLFHFAGHGRSDDSTDPPVREMLLSAYTTHGSDAAPRSDVKADRTRAAFSLDDLREALPDRPPWSFGNPGPLVVLNACRLGPLSANLG